MQLVLFDIIVCPLKTDSIISFLMYDTDTRTVLW